MVVGGVGFLTMIVSGIVVYNGLQEDCKKGFQDEVTCDPDEEQIESGLHWMGAGALLTLGAIAVIGTIDLIEWAGKSATTSEENGEVRARRKEDEAIPIPAAP